MTTRVLVAHDAGARVFETSGPSTGLELVSSTDFEDGRRANIEIESDRPGRAFDRAGAGRHAMGSEVEPREHAIRNFAKALAHDLAQDHHAGKFRQLILIAAPHFLGVLRAELEDRVSKTLVGTLAKDLPRASAEELLPYVREFVHV